ncbi:Sulfate/bicarbonate/oxalate exchanger and transporter sat-1 [Corchorus olitorius]|uniref:Sulfate/bicarbonate/oxalate exchanger and transporter sat-1 n=1 Tax=Corchorus olitorius TaxID=93759 RepID=A0A1R3G2G9_9ROSI|nr:Sulfate/bicarbonate/oxalate exchanger and transporter sat-1 [Corchorus olitorius]
MIIQILLLVNDHSKSYRTLWIYDATSNVWDHQYVFCRYDSPPDYTFPVNDLDLLHSNSNSNTSFVINGGVDYAREALLLPLGLMNVFKGFLPPMPNAEKLGIEDPRYPCSWHLLSLRDKKLCVLLVFSYPLCDDQDVGTTYKTFVGFGTFDLVQPTSTSSQQKPWQYKIGELNKIKFTDIAIGWEFLLPCATIVPCTKCT